MRILDFSDGFDSSAEPNQGTISASALQTFASDGAFVAAKGSAAAAGDLYYNTATNTYRIHNGTAFADIVDTQTVQSAIGGNKTFSDDVTITGDLTVNGTTTTINTTNLAVTDANITINDTGNDASSEGSGLTIERTGTDGSLVYEDALGSKFKCGALSSELEIAQVSGAQTITDKDIDGATASNTSRITLPKETTTNIASLNRKEATMLYDTTLNKPVFDDGANPIEIGTGTTQGSGIVTINQNNLDMNSNVEILTGDSDDPTSVAKSASIGSFYYRDATAEVYIKQDGGSSTNWSLIAAGAITPTFLGFRAKASAAQTINNNADDTIVFETEDFDDDTMYNNSTGEATIPSGQGGIWQIHSQIQIASFTDQNDRLLKFKVGGVETLRTQAYNVGTLSRPSTMLLNSILELSASDVCRIDAFQNSGSSRNLQTQSFINWFSMHKIG